MVNEKKVDGEKKTESEKKIDGDRKNDGTKKADNTVPVEDKLAQLEKRFAELESKVINLKEKSATGELGSPREAEGAKPAESTDTANKGDTLGEAKKVPSADARICVITVKRDENGELVEHDENVKLINRDEPQNGYAAVLRKKTERRDPYGTIEVLDPDLRQLLKKVLAHYPGHYFIGEQMEIPSPYEPFLLNWDLLQEESEKEPLGEKDKQARSDLRELLHKVKAGSGDTKLDSYMKARDDLIKQKSITFDALWTVFPPGTVIYSNIFFKQDQIFIVEDNVGPWPQEPEAGSRRSGGTVYWKLRCWTYDFTGQAFMRQCVVLRIQQFDGPKPITALPFYPLSMVDPDKRRQIEARLLERGRKFLQYCIADQDHRMYEYSGEAIFDQQGFRSIQVADGNDSDDTYIPAQKSQTRMTLTESDVMVDFGSYLRHCLGVAQIGDLTVSDDISECLCTECTNNEAQEQLFKRGYDRSLQNSQDWEDFQLMLFPPRVLGYALKDKHWAQFAVENLGETKKEDANHILERLHLSGQDKGKRKKDLLLSLVTSHGTEKGELQDLVADKGKGLVFLLYGAPGVGKTSTAQMVARAARKPLLPISVADVGTKARVVETKLANIFEIAATWKAILLIDEADVFLQSRSQGTKPSAEGSALVSVFLKVLEYYRGIMFLTTNQIAQFDVAVQSRVHIALKYEKLNEDQTSKIFMGFIDQFREKGVVESSDYDNIKKFGEEDLHVKEFDGRQIRNIVACAMGFAVGQKARYMKLEHILHVVRYVEEFQKDLAGQMKTWYDRQAGTKL